MIVSDIKQTQSISNVIGEMNIKNKPFAIKVQTSYNIYTASQCDKCHEGYKGRTGIYEAFIMTPDLNIIINNNPSEYDIKEATATQGLTTLEEDAILKILQGETSFEEMSRVVEL